LFLNASYSFPDVEQANEEGIVAFGGDLHPERILTAYKQGIFPWFNEGELPIWWSPNPRCVLFPEQLVIQKSMRSLLRGKSMSFKINLSFKEVMEACKTIHRPGQEGTWISEDVITAYTKLNQMGYGFSFEAWQEDSLIGGLYGLKIGSVFFGESMFAKKTNASKFAFIKAVQFLQELGVELIDCQVHTDHLESLGAVMIERKWFIDLLKKWI
jgi:leucyl/phenylalanyl-tRNA--protein transferase